MADEKPKTLWPIAEAKLREGVPSPHNSSLLTVVRSDGKTLRVEFDPALRALVLTPMAPVKAKSDKDPPSYADHPTKKGITVPVENVLYMK